MSPHVADPRPNTMSPHVADPRPNTMSPHVADPRPNTMSPHVADPRPNTMSPHVADPWPTPTTALSLSLAQVQKSIVGGLAPFSLSRSSAGLDYLANRWPRMLDQGCCPYVSEVCHHQQVVQPPSIHRWRQGAPLPKLLHIAGKMAQAIRPVVEGNLEGERRSVTTTIVLSSMMGDQPLLIPNVNLS